jgi:hypothetical protein
VVANQSVIASADSSPSNLMRQSAVLQFGGKEKIEGRPFLKNTCPVGFFLSKVGHKLNIAKL